MDQKRRLAIAVSEISELGAARPSMQDSEELYRGLFSTMTEGCALHEIVSGPGVAPRDYRFLDINPAFERLTGLKREDAVGRTWKEVLPGDDPFWARIYGEVAQRGTPSRFEDSLRALNRFYEVFTFYPSRERFALMLMDVSRRKQVEKELRESREEVALSHAQLEELVAERTAQLGDTVKALVNEIEERKRIETRLSQLSRVFMDASDSIIIEDLTGKIIEVNREVERAYGWTREELIGKPVTVILPAKRHATALQLRRLCLEGREIRSWEAQRRRKSGETIPVLLSMFPLLGASGEIAALATSAKGIKERKEMEAKLNESRERLQELSRRTVQALEADRQSMSRELHDSIGGNLAALKFILEECQELTSKGSPAAASLENAISFLSQTIKESKRIAAMMRPLTLDDLGILTTLRGYIKQFAEQYKTIRVDSRIDIREEDVTEEQKIMLYRILQEALTNAAKHAQASAVLVNLKIASGSIVLEVKDNGCGFDSRQVMSRNDPLSGLGLKSMRERVEICRGVFSIESGHGRGTLFRVSLPAEAVSPDESTEISAAGGRTAEQND